ncbi:endolytic transglycosylase MltG [Frankia sp. Mgl5]|uniref:endolytic transglycosylase MltG n=1 Tax=Frankia sp. Mgl5 TaxID=2933793 RepID=UPI00200F8280|nr:endolytic transglycosylase MltG [Frankia sp. Mgl5]MCK9930433.1 endolytic transglycosylase MltG [Frankia sp. Mgl5]
MIRDGDGFDELLDGAGYDDYDDRDYDDRAYEEQRRAPAGARRSRRGRAGSVDGRDRAGLAAGEREPAGYGDGFEPDEADAYGAYGGAYDDDADGGPDDGAAPPRRGRDDDRGRPGGRRPGSALPKLIGVLVVVAVLVGAGIFGVGKVIGRIGGEPAADYAGSGEGIVVVQVPAGATSSEIAGRLAASDVIASRQAFVNLASRDQRALSIQPGTYRLRSKMSAAAALDALLDDASSALFRYTISPGDTVRQVFKELSTRTGTPVADLEAIARKPSTLGLPDYATGLEGYLFPSTYDVAPGTDPVDVLKEAVARFRANAEEIDLVGRAEAGHVKPQDVVIIASIIEKEVANEGEGPKVARVIYNRLNDTSGRFRRIDMDSTTRYALDEYEGPLTDAQLRQNNPYNTRAVEGLPPGAISNPSTWAIKSALSPAQGSWFYFVSMPQTHETVFATTDAEFQDALDEYHRQGGAE